MASTVGREIKIIMDSEVAVSILNVFPMKTKKKGNTNTKHVREPVKTRWRDISLFYGKNTFYSRVFYYYGRLNPLSALISINSTAPAPESCLRNDVRHSLPPPLAHPDTYSLVVAAA